MLFAVLLELTGRPCVLTRILGQNIEEYVGVHEDGQDYSPLVKAMIASVVMRTVPFPRKRRTSS